MAFFFRLRSKIRVPYQTLSSHVVRLERLQQASDVLRRASRFVVLTRRLQVQLVEMDRAAESTPSAVDNKTTSLNGSKSPDLTGGEVTRKSTDSLNTITGAGGAGNEEDDNQRAIAKAALSIAELSQSVLHFQLC